MSEPHSMDQVKIEPHHGNVEVTLGACCTNTFSRAEAMELMVRLASAIQMSGDMCDPDAVFLYEDMLELQKRFP